MLQLVGVLLPALIDMINNHVKNSEIRFWVSVGVCALVATVLDYLVGGFTGVEDWSKDVLSMFGVAQITYLGFYENSVVREDVSRLTGGEPSQDVENPYK